jgi:hypothetical protein
MAAGRVSTGLPTPAADKQHCCRRTASERGIFGVAGELVHFGVVGSLMRLKAGAVGVALGWAVAPGIGATGVQDHEGPRA